MASQNGPPQIPSYLMVHFELNHHIGVLIGYLTLAIVCLVALLKIPAFIKYRLWSICRPSSFKYKGYFLSRAPGINTKPIPSNKSELKHHLDSSPSTNGTASKLMRAKCQVNRLNSKKILHFNLGNVLLMLLYATFLVILAIYKNTYEGVTISKYRRFGYIAIAQFPLMFILAMKNSPLSFLTGVGYEKLNFFHRFVGRMIFAFSIVHASIQMRLQYELTNSIHFKDATLYGLIALCTFALMNLMGFKYLRNAFYQFFLVVHILGYLTVIVALWVHTKSTHPYLGASIAFLVLDNLLNMFKSRVKRATFTAMPAGLTRIEVQGINNGWRAGQHIFIRVLKGRNIFEKHPFTIANAPNSSTPYGSTGHLLLVVKAAGDFTRRIHQLAGQPQQSYLHPGEKSATSLAVGADLEREAYTRTSDTNTFLPSDVSHPVLIDGPYGTFFTDMARYRTVLLCAGGSGFTYCMATLEDIIGEAMKSGAGLTKHIFIVWSLREPGMLKCFGRDIEETLRASEHCGIDVTIKIFFTKGRSEANIPQSLVDRSVEFYSTRPDLPQIIGDVINGKALITGGGLGVGACGPLGLVDSVVQGVNNLNPERVKQIGGVKLHTERFGW